MTAAKQVRFHGAQVILADKLEDGRPPFGVGFAGNGDFASDAAIRGQSGGGSRGDDAGLCGQALQHLLEEDALLLGRVVAAGSERNTREEDFIGIEAEINVLQSKETANRQAGAGEHQDGERHFGDDQSRAEFAVAETSANALAGVGEPGLQGAAHGMDCRGKAAEQRG